MQKSNTKNVLKNLLFVLKNTRLKKSTIFLHIRLYTHKMFLERHIHIETRNISSF